MARKQQDALASERTGRTPGSLAALRRAYLLEFRDELIRRRDELMKECDELRDDLSKFERAIEVPQAPVIAQNDARLRMFETYMGEVVRVHGDRVVVVYEVGEDLVEQTYVRGQFLDRQLPKKGDRLAVYVTVAEVPPGEEAASSEEVDESGEHDEPPRRRKNVVPLPRTF